MKVALYARVSTEEQSTDQQLITLREFSSNKNHEIVREYVDVISGIKDSRPALDLLMKDAFAGLFNAVLVWKLDRLGRSTQHLVSIVNQWKKHNIEFIAVTQQFDTTTPNGKLLFHLFAAIAEFERDLISERTKLGLKRAVNVGKRGPDKKRRKKAGYILRFAMKRQKTEQDKGIYRPVEEYIKKG